MNRILTALLAATALITSASQAAAQASDTDIKAKAESFTLSEPAGNPGKTQDLWATHYFVHAAAEDGDGVPLFDKAGKPISAKISPRDWCGAAIEGTVQVTAEGKVSTLNYAGIGGKSYVDCAAVTRINPVKNPWILSTGKSYFTAAKGLYGDGVAGYALIPFRTVAVDKKNFPYGSVIYIAAARGVEITLPDGQKASHDGYFFAGDTGGAIKGNHIDVFCGVQSTNCFPGFVKSMADKTFSAVIVKDATLVAALSQIHGK